MTIDELYEAFMDEGRFAADPKSFGEDIFEFLGPRVEGLDWTAESWAKEYGMYLPTYDYGDIDLSKRERDVDYANALDTLRLTQKATDRVYTTEMDTLSTGLGKEMAKGRESASRVGLRSGGLEAAIGDTIAISGSKAKNLGDRLGIAEQQTKDKYNTVMVDTALDFDKSKRDEKREFYDRTMAALIRLEGLGAFKQNTCICQWHVDQEWYVDCRNQGGTHGDCEVESMTDDCKDIVTGNWC